MSWSNRNNPSAAGHWLAAALLALAGIAEAAELPGTLAWSDRVGMGPLVSGVVRSVAVTPGQRVARGAELLTLDARGFDAELRGARAELARAEVLLEEAQREDERAVELYDRTLLSEHERTLATIALREAEAQMQRARAHLTAAQLDVERSRLAAPFDGLVLSVNATPGQVVVSELQSQVLLELAADSDMLLQVQADLATANQIAQAGNAVVEVAGQRLPVKDVRIGLEPVGHAEAGALYAVQVRFERPRDMLLRAGQGGRLAW